MDIAPEPGSCVIAAIEINPAQTEMIILQSCGGETRVLERLQKRMPPAFLSVTDAEYGEEEAAFGYLRAILGGFLSAAKDYDAQTSFALVSELPIYGAKICDMAREMGLECRILDTCENADVIISDLKQNFDKSEFMSTLFIMPETGNTCLFSGDGINLYVLKFGMDAGNSENMIISAREKATKQLSRRKYALDMRAIMTDDAHACARCLSAMAQNTYQLVLCLNFPEEICHEGVLTSKQLSRMADGFAHALEADGAELGFLCDFGQVKRETYRQNCMRRALNALVIAQEIAQRTGISNVKIIRTSVAQAAARAQACGRTLSALGQNTPSAVRRAEHIARTYGGDLKRAAFVEQAARMMCSALGGAFTQDEQECARNLIKIAALLGECMRPERGGEFQQIIDTAWLPGMSAQDRRRVTEICEACALSDNNAIYEKLMPETIRLENEASDAEEMFSGEMIEMDEFTPGDDFDYAPMDEVWTLNGLESDSEIELPPHDERVYTAEKFDQGCALCTDDENEKCVGIQHSGEMARMQTAAPLEMRLAAIMALAQALDRSGRLRLSQLSVKRGSRGITLRASSVQSATSESLMFRYRAALFEKVFGMRARLKIDKRRANEDG